MFILLIKFAFIYTIFFDSNMDGLENLISDLILQLLSYMGWREHLRDVLKNKCYNM